MVRIPGKVLGVVAALALVAQAMRVVPEFHASAYGHTEFGVLVFLPTLATLLLGRVLLAWLPPGEVGGHSWSELPATLATSLALGTLAHAFFAALNPWPGTLTEIVIAALLLVARLLTLPGAMVPRHRVRAEPWGVLDALLSVLVVLWSGYLLCTTEALGAHLWLALAVLVFAALGTPRRARGGRWLALLALASLGAPYALREPDASQPFTARIPVVALALCATAACAWLRRADRRAGALAGLAAGTVLLGGQDPLALAAPLVLIAASPARMRAYAAAWSGASLLLCALGGLLAQHVWPRERGLDGDALLFALHPRGETGLLAAGVLVALLLGLLSLRWKAPLAQPGRIDEPRREVLAVLALLGLTLLATLPSASPWSEPAVVALGLPLALLAAGLLVIPPARVT